MTLYSIALFLHVVGALLLFVTLTVEGVALLQVRRAATAEAAEGAAAVAAGAAAGAVAAGLSAALSCA